MLFNTHLFVALGLFASALGAPVAQEGHEHLHAKRGGSGTCSFPNYDGMVAVQSSGKNAGWAMSSDQSCSYGSWCPYACQPGQLMGQWDQKVTSYSYPGSQHGGLYCDDNGNLQKSNNNKDYCYDGAGTVSAKNSAGSDVAFCQTVLPGNEDMLIPTSVGSGSTQVLAVPGTDYFASTAAHYYINPPGVSTDDACQWGDDSHAQGNWAPYVAGANQESNGDTYVKIGWNPKFTGSSLSNNKPNFGIKITCDDEGSCDGLPCSIDPSKGSVNDVTSKDSSSGAGGADFCVVTAKNGAHAKVEIFSAGGN
ncbi:YMR244W [Zygosaccharomyces parabailii]|uniref:BN860_13740g1_1 n=1 Tax=Zygosaccharomyces bailii (strain CLIB 213 / ATCC 58445 / CBS 680 / BCRC 21525 / NBRC 1098 / NCYC 1416 / NRRL Y-2227) TaxID=1333698 RepID=A0A8J2X6S1_ZYGB2|nr:YMR244W [Zygosaccharomyces parabailii]CDF88586.1 BN860_13740g1_1 [Zygosaccharomyces bailii CLIB 213]CDH14536.1 related to Similarity to Uth1p, Nca3p, YIL123w and Sun4p [Zygosaccharomyces bailii ISA1307]